MYHFDVFDLLLCFKYFSPQMIQLTSFLLSIIGCLLIRYGLSKIPFFIDAHIYEFFFFLNIPFFFFIISFNIIFFIFRCCRLMNTDLNLWGFGLAIIEIYISIFGIITNILNDIMIFYNISFYQQKALKKNSSKTPILTEVQLKSTKIILPIILFMWINILYLSITDCILINYKINGSYYTYRLALNQENLFSEEYNAMKNVKKKKKKKEKNKTVQEINDNKNNNESITILNNENTPNNNINIQESVNPLNDEEKNSRENTKNNINIIENKRPSNEALEKNLGEDINNNNNRLKDSKFPLNEHLEINLRENNNNNNNGQGNTQPSKEHSEKDLGESTNSYNNKCLQDSHRPLNEESENNLGESTNNYKNNNIQDSIGLSNYENLEKNLGESTKPYNVINLQDNIKPLNDEDLNKKLGENEEK